MALIGVFSVVLLDPPAGAAQDATTLTEPESELVVDPVLQVVDQATFVKPDSNLWFDVSIDPLLAPPETEPFVSVIIHGAFEADDDLDSPLPAVINRTALLPVSSLERLSDDQGIAKNQFRVTVPIRGGPQRDDQVRLLLPSEGIYPITIELRTEQGTLASTTTRVVRLDSSSVDEPNGSLALVVRVSTDGPLDIEQATRLLHQHPEPAVTILFEPGVLDELRSDNVAAEALIEATAGRPVLASPEPDLDPSALAEIGHADLYREAVDLVNDELITLGFTPAEAVHTTGSMPTTEGLAVVDELGAKFILDLEGRAATSGTVRAGGSGIRVVTADRELSGTLTGEGGAQRANRLLSTAALRHLSEEAEDRPSPVPVVLTPGRFEAPGDLIATIDALLAGLAQPGAPDTRLISQLTGSRRDPLVRAAERPTQDLRPVATVLAGIRSKVGTYESFNPGAPQIRRNIPAALSRESSPEDRLRMLQQLDATIEAGLSVIELHDGQSVTMAARSAPIPVVLESSADGPRQVLLRLRSDKISSDDDEQLLEVRPGTSSIDVELVTRSLGVSPLEVSVWTPDGSTQLAVTNFEIRSTAIPGLGLALIAGAVGLLVAWWVIDARKRRGQTDEIPSN